MHNHTQHATHLLRHDACYVTIGLPVGQIMRGIIWRKILLLLRELEANVLFIDRWAEGNV